MILSRKYHRLILQRKALRCMCWSTILAVVTIAVAYVVDNASGPTLVDMTVGQRVEQIRGLAGFRDVVDTTIVAINVAYDKELVDVNDEFGLPLGKIDITDRSKLLCLLKILEEKKDYRYILLDVSLDRQYRSDSDSALAAMILSMPRIVIPGRGNNHLVDDRLCDKSADAEYTSSLLINGFVKYNYFSESDGAPSVALRIYEDLGGVDVKKYGPVCVSDGRIVNGSSYLIFDNPLCSHYYADGAQRWYALGTDLLDIYDDEDISQLMKDKIVVIGAFTENDFHDTYVGPVSGPVIHYTALRSLLAGYHHIGVMAWLLRFIIYFAIYFWIFYGAAEVLFNSLLGRIHILRNRFVNFVLSFVSIGICLYCISVVCWLVWRIEINVVVPTAIIGLIKIFKIYLYETSVNQSGNGSTAIVHNSRSSR